MRIATRMVLAGLGVLLATQYVSVASEADSHHPFAISKRVPWTTSRVKGTPDPPSPYRTEPAFPHLKFEEPLAMTCAPKGDRLFVTERFGRVYSFPNDPEVKKAELFLDLNEGLEGAEAKRRACYGFAIHPEFATNGYVYITYVLDAIEERPQGTRVSRFRVSDDNHLRCDLTTETILLEWPSGGHNGGCLTFGPDGYLYVATGDSSGIADEYLTGQDLSKLPGSILRIDVDHPDGGKAYGIPQGNPFVDRSGARPEIWAYGLRQPWKMSFDRATGELWTGNVGQDLWEQIYRIERGGNYGWSVTEGSHPFRPERTRGPTAILPPIVEHHHAEFRSITGGYVYRGRRLKSLVGAYVYGDYDTGKIWAFRYDGENGSVTEQKELVDSSLRLVGFAEDRAGELYLVDHMGGGIHRLVPNPAPDAQSAFPRKLSETGLFRSVKEHTPAPGLIPYTVNAPMWSDGASKEWFLAVPDKAQIEFESIEYPQPAPGARLGWKFPDGTVLVETLALEMELGNPASRRRLETRILHHDRLFGTEEIGDQYWRGYTYLWNDAQTDATLLEAPAGLDKTSTINDPGAPGGQRRQTWHFPSRTECTVCHNMAAKYVLGANTLQMNKDHDYGGVVVNQLRMLERLSIFADALPARADELPRLVDYRDETKDRDQRARSYLHANCSHCHRKWGGGNADFQLLYSLSLPEMGILSARPGQGTFLMANAHLVAPGDPYRSVLFYRMAKLGPGRMPRLGSTVVDRRGLDLIHDWIEQLPTQSNGDPAITDSAMQNRAQVRTLLHRLETSGSPSAEATANTLDQLLASTSGSLQLMWAVDAAALTGPLRQAVIDKASKHSDPQVRDLFEKFLPEEQRTKRLGSAVKPEEILALQGDPARGKQVFFNAAGVQCQNCHRIAGQGTELGPDLSHVGSKYSQAQLLDTILEPSKEIDQAFVTYAIETRNGQVYIGLLVQKAGDEVVLKDARNNVIRVPATAIARMVPQQQSLMPELLLRDMTARDVAEKTLRRAFARLAEIGEGTERPPAREIPAIGAAAKEGTGNDLAEAIRRFADDEGVIHLDDLLLRRGDWGDDPRTLERTGQVVGEMLGWDEVRLDAELDRLAAPADTENSGRHP